MTQPSAAVDADLQALHSALDKVSTTIRLAYTILDHKSQPALSSVPGKPTSASSPRPSPSSTESSAARASHPPFTILSTAASLLHAHVTRVSLLALYPPFTPSALAKCVNSLEPPLNSLVAITQGLNSPDSSASLLVGKEVSSRLFQLSRALEGLLLRVPKDADQQRGLESEDAEKPLDRYVIGDLAGKDGAQGGRNARQRVLRGTGVVWASCGWFVELKASSIGGLARTMIVQSQRLVDDAVHELEDWAGGDEGSAGDYDAATRGLEDLGISDDSDQDFDDRDETCTSDFRPQAQLVLRRLRQVFKVYPLLLSRTEPDDARERALALDGKVTLARNISNHVDEVVGYMYEYEKEEADREMKDLERIILEGLDNAKIDSELIKRWSTPMQRLL